MKDGPKKNVTILMPEELYKRLDAQAKASSRSLSSYIRQALKCHLLYLDQFREAFGRKIEP